MGGLAAGGLILYEAGSCSGACTKGLSPSQGSRVFGMLWLPLRLRSGGFLLGVLGCFSRLPCSLRAGVGVMLDLAFRRGHWWGGWWRMIITLLLSPALAEGPGSSGLGWGVDVPLVSLLSVLQGAL
jgi:hypothetical protein